MRGSDIGGTILIIVVVFVLILLNFLYIMKARIENNWVKYRCNPIVIPFAGLFGKNSMQTFTYCIQEIQKNYMSFVLAPTHFNLQTINLGGQKMAAGINNIVKFISGLRSMFGSITGGIFGIFMNIIIEVQRMLIGVGDLSGKLMGLVVTLLYLIQGTIYTANSTWSGPVGGAVRALCFSANTTIKLQNGNYKKLKDIALGDILRDGSEVQGLLTLKNWSTESKNDEWFYTLPHGENGEPIFVTGKHLIKYKHRYIYVKDHPDAKISDYKEDTLYCLITNTNNIPIGKYIFWDWEDTPQMNQDAERYKFTKYAFNVPSLICDL